MKIWLKSLSNLHKDNGNDCNCNKISYWILYLEEVVLIQSGTCEESGLSTLTSSKDCQEKSKSVGIYDKKVYSGQSSNEVCGCRAFSHKGNLDALHWNDPKGSCSPATKCTTQSQCVCLKKGIRTIFYTSKYKLTA